jgi:hypothetical protein
MKKFRNNAELAHAWANDTHDSGKGSNMYFLGDVIYSYGTHYQIARKVKTPNGQIVIFVNGNGYSNSTAKHTNHVWQALPDYAHTFKVPFVEGLDGYRTVNYFNLDYLPAIIIRMLIDVKNKCFDQINARSYFGHYAEASSKYVDIMHICSLFGIECPPRPENWNEAEKKAEHLRATVKEREKAAEQKKLEKNKELLNKWLNNNYNGQLYNIPVHLRISKDGTKVETTKGASVSVVNARLLLERLKRNDNIKGYDIEGFKVIENSPEAVKIGCHLIAWNVINAINI